MCVLKIFTRLNNMKRIKDKGFSLIEILIALTVLVFGIYGVVDLFFTSHNLSNRSIAQTQAVYLARGKLAELMTVKPEELFSRIEDSNSVYTFEPILMKTDSSFTCTCNLTRDAANPQMLRIDVMVISKQFKDASASLFSYIFAHEG